jgi:hypothetical protein
MDVAVPTGTFCCCLAGTWFVVPWRCMYAVLYDACCRRLQASTLQAYSSLLFRVLHSSVTLLQTGLTAAQVVRGVQGYLLLCGCCGPVALYTGWLPLVPLVPSCSFISEVVHLVMPQLAC